MGTEQDSGSYDRQKVEVMVQEVKELGLDTPLFLWLLQGEIRASVPKAMELVREFVGMGL